MTITDKGSKKILIDDCNISLKDTFDCGQCFRWEFDGEGWVGVVGKRVVRCVQSENGFIIENTTVEDVENFWKYYFDLEKDYGKIVDDFGHYNFFSLERCTEDDLPEDSYYFSKKRFLDLKTKKL